MSSRIGQIGRNIILRSVGSNGKNDPEDVKRLRQLLNRKKGTDILADGYWDEEAEEELANQQGLFLSNIRDANVKPLTKDSQLLELAVKNQVAFPLPKQKGMASILAFHNSLKGRIAWSARSAVYVTKSKSSNWHALFWKYQAIGSAYYFPSFKERIACDCTSYANLLLAIHYHNNAGGWSYRASVADIGPQNSLGRRYKMKRIGEFKKWDALKFFKEKASSSSVYFLDVIGANNAHAVIAVYDGKWTALQCSASQGGVVSGSLLSYIKNSGYIREQGCVIWNG